MKKTAILILAFFIIPSVTSIYLDQVKPDTIIPQQPRMFGIQSRSTEQVETTQYIITLHDADSLPTPIKVSELPRQEKDIVENQLTTYFNNELKGNWLSQRTFTAHLTPTKKAALENHPYIASVEKNHELTPFLNSAKQTIHADTFTTLTGNITLNGAGNTICILDTGIDYTHQDFGSCSLSQPSQEPVNITPFGPEGYDNNQDLSFSIQRDWPTIQLYFEYVDTQGQGTDEVIIKQDGTIVQTYYGNHSSFWTPLISGSNITVEFRSDDSINGSNGYEGFEISSARQAEHSIDSCPQITGGIDVADGTTSASDPSDGGDHGTHVAGIIAANGTNVGVAPGASVYMVDVFDGNAASTSSIILGVRHCVEIQEQYNISAISMSLGTPDTYQPYCAGPSLEPVIQEARDAGIPVFAATGNEGVLGNESYPACLQNVYSVAATTDGDSRAPFSNIAEQTTFAAPGESITATNEGGGSTTKSGTSMATPIISAAVAIADQLTNNPIELLLNHSPTLNITYETPRVNFTPSLLPLRQGTLTTPTAVGETFTIQYEPYYENVNGTLTVVNKTVQSPYETNITELQLTEGNQTVTVSYQYGDNTDTQTNTFIVDTTPPNILNISPPNGTNLSTLTTNVTVTTSDATHVTTLYNGVQNNTVPTNQTVTVTVKDQANNTNTTTLFYPYDGDLLSTTLTAPNSTNTFIPRLTYQSKATCTAKVNNHTFQPPHPKPNQTREGKNTFSVTCTDTVTSLTKTQTFIIDVTPPQTTLTTQNNTVILETDEPATTRYTIQNTSLYTGPIQLPDGTHTITYYSTDPAGNNETPVTKHVTIDTTPPNITGLKTYTFPVNTTIDIEPVIEDTTQTTHTVTIHNTKNNTIETAGQWNVTVNATDTYNQTTSKQFQINTSQQPFLTVNTPLPTQFSPYKPVTIDVVADTYSLNATCGNTTYTILTFTCNASTLNITATLQRFNTTTTVSHNYTRNATLPNLSISSPEEANSVTPINITFTGNLTVKTQNRTYTRTTSPTRIYPQLPGSSQKILVTATATNLVGNTTQTAEVLVNEQTRLTTNTTGNASTGSATHTPPTTTPLSTYIGQITSLNTTNITVQLLKHSILSYNVTADTLRKSAHFVSIPKPVLDENGTPPSNITFYADSTQLNTTWTGTTTRNDETYYTYRFFTTHYSTFTATPPPEPILDSDSSGSNSGSGESSLGGTDSGSSGGTGGGGGGVPRSVSTPVSDFVSAETEEEPPQTVQVTHDTNTLQIHNPNVNPVEAIITVTGDIAKYTNIPSSITVTDTENIAYTLEQFYGYKNGTIVVETPEQTVSFPIEQTNPLQVQATIEQVDGVDLTYSCTNRETVEFSFEGTSKNVPCEDNTLTLPIPARNPSTIEWILGEQTQYQNGEYTVSIHNDTRTVKITQEWWKNDLLIAVLLLGFLLIIFTSLTASTDSEVFRT